MIAVNRMNLGILFLAQLIFVSGSAMTVTMGGIVGSSLAHAPEFSTVPVSLVILGTAFGTIPAATIMRRFGRKLGFIGACILALAGTLLAKQALAEKSFALYCTATTITGFSIAFGHQLRFAAAENVPLNRAAQAIAFILMGSIGGAIVGPQLIASGYLIVAQDALQGALSGAAVLYGVGALVLAGYSNMASVSSDHRHENDTATSLPSATSYKSLLNEPLLVLAIFAGVVGQGIMSFIMTATPVSMHVMDGHSLDQTAGVVRAHVIAMYAPSLVSGWLISRLGERNMMLWGIVIYFATLLFGFAGHQVFHYSGAMILLGVGWNFLFVGGTSLLVKTYRPQDRFKAQTLNEALVFGISALGSLLAGTILAAIGWNAVLISTLPIMMLMGLWLLKLRTRPLPSYQ